MYGSFSCIAHHIKTFTQFAHLNKHVFFLSSFYLFTYLFFVEAIGEERVLKSEYSEAEVHMFLHYSHIC